MVNVSLGPVGGLCVLHTNVAPLGTVPVFVNVVKFTIVIGHTFVSLVSLIIGAVLPAAQQVATVESNA